MLGNKKILLIISGGIAAYKALELVRQLQRQGAHVRAILTAGGAQFITPLSVSALTGEKVFEDLFSLTDEAEMGHIRLTREADLVIVAPATANLMARVAGGRADDLASTVLLASSAPVIFCPAMNSEMWLKPQTQRNVRKLIDDGYTIFGPGEGDLACGETGPGRLLEVDEIITALQDFFNAKAGRMAGFRALVTAGPTREALDPVRFISNRSSGKQGYAIAAALRDLGFRTILVSGPTALSAPDGVERIEVETALEMEAAVLSSLPVDVAVCTAAVSDWRSAAPARQKIKKGGEGVPNFNLVENPDILAELAQVEKNRPRLVVGFAAETNNIVAHAKAKLERKKCDWILANDVSVGTGVFGGEDTHLHLVTKSGVEDFGASSKHAGSRILAEKIAQALEQ